MVAIDGSALDDETSRAIDGCCENVAKGLSRCMAIASASNGWWSDAEP